jgi:hypothetical protein
LQANKELAIAAAAAAADNFSLRSGTSETAADQMEKWGK